ncbi:MAG: ribosome silencing factor [Acidobacteria bacterium 13_1_20CM_2_68_14]|nr:MAG: ribosome silencing factor [Acidobacteria bacterium 13_1_20CM_2_68_14]
MVLEAATDKKGEDPVALNLKGIASFTDCFVIVGGTQRRQTQAICDAIIERLAAKGQRPGHLEGYNLGDWILIDYADLVVHVFTRETREFYGLENLWGDAPRMNLARPESRSSRDTSAARKG